jgi:8-amino-7-oxononanoate synthase
VPWSVGQPAAAVRLSSRLQELGVDVRAIRPPSVPEGSARLRLTVTAAHSPEAVDRALGAMATALASGLE